MNYVEIKFSLAVDRVASQKSIEVKRGDTLNRLIISLSEHGCPYEISEECRAFYVEGDIMHSCVVDDNRIIYDLTTQTVGTVGKHSAEIRLIGYNDEVITTAKFTIIVVNTIYDDEVQETVPQNDVDALTGLISEATQLIAEVNESLDNGDFDGEKGDPGKSAYDIAVKGGFKGTEEEWIASLKGGKGDPGEDGTSVTVSKTTESAEDGGNNVVSFSDGKSVTIKNGKKGNKGDAGESAYEIAVRRGFKGTEEEWLESLNSTKMDRPSSWVNGNLVKFDEDGNVVDSGFTSSSFLPQSVMGAAIAPHLGNSEIHVTAADKARWDAGLNVDAIVSSVIEELPKYNGEVASV